VKSCVARDFGKEDGGRLKGDGGRKGGGVEGNARRFLRRPLTLRGRGEVTLSVASFVAVKTLSCEKEGKQERCVGRKSFPIKDQRQSDRSDLPFPALLIPV
jgi:hypothetical protein